VRRLRALLATCIAAAAFQAGAATCTVSASGLAFGTYDLSASTPLDVAGSVDFRCNEPSAVRIQISPGGAATYWPRAMRSGSATLDYNLYTSAPRTQVWGDGSGGTSVRTIGAGRGEAVPIYGRIPALQSVPSGTYADVLVVTFEF